MAHRKWQGQAGRSVVDGEQVEHRAKKNNDGYGNDQSTYQPVDEYDAIFLEIGPDLVD